METVVLELFRGEIISDIRPSRGGGRVILHVVRDARPVFARYLSTERQIGRMKIVHKVEKAAHLRQHTSIPTSMI